MACLAVEFLATSCGGGSGDGAGSGTSGPTGGTSPSAPTPAPPASAPASAPAEAPPPAPAPTTAVVAAVGTAPGIVTQPAGAAVAGGQSFTLAVVASGSAPLHYQWTLNGAAVGPDAASYSVAQAQTSDAGTYTVVVTNASGSATSSAAVVTVSGGNGPDLALGKTAFESSEQNAGLTAKFAFDGDLTTRWASAQGIDPSWIAVDLGATQPVDRVVLNWENAYASQYEIQTSPDNQAWTDALPAIAGRGGVETIDFPTRNTRYVRMLGTQRATTFGYSLLEFQVFDVPQCGGATERYTPIPAQPGTWNSTIAGLPSGPFVPTVTDNVTGLTWQQYATTFPRPVCKEIRPRVSCRRRRRPTGASIDRAAHARPWALPRIHSIRRRTTCSNRS